MHLIVLTTLILLSAVCVSAQISAHRIVFEKLHREPSDGIVPIFRNNINMNYIQQKLDHFDANEKRTWYMRYLSNDYYFKENGPIFIFVGGEWSISEGYMRGGHMFDMARSLNGYLFYTEHRFYGRSQPMSKLTRESLNYLSIKQALADLAHFIRTVKSTIPGLSRSKVILVGGSYSATMVAWFRREYPNLAQGAWASSAPLLAKVDFQEYKEVMGQSILAASGQACYDRIQKGIKALEDHINSNDLSAVRQYLNMCQNFNPSNPRDVSSFFYLISEIFASLVQSRTRQAIATACNLILSHSDDISGVTAFINSEIRSTQCIDYSYNAEIAELQDQSLTGIMRQWYYQTCNEFAWFQTSTSLEQPFGATYPVEHFYHVCAAVYGNEFTPEKIQANIDATNAHFGGMEPQVTNVFFTHGSLDPWKAMGLHYSNESGTVVPFYSHCKDLASKSPSDTAEMTKLKDQLFELVKRWIA